MGGLCANRTDYSAANIAYYRAPQQNPSYGCVDYKACAIFVHFVLMNTYLWICLTRC